MNLCFIAKPNKGKRIFSPFLPDDNAIWFIGFRPDPSLLQCGLIFLNCTKFNFRGSEIAKSSVRLMRSLNLVLGFSFASTNIVMYVLSFCRWKPRGLLRASLQQVKWRLIGLCSSSRSTHTTPCQASKTNCLEPVTSGWRLVKSQSYSASIHPSISSSYPFSSGESVLPD